MTAALSLAIKFADEVEQFPLGRCGPSDDPDKQYAYTAGFRDVAKRFVAAVMRIGDAELSDLVSGLNTSPECIVQAHELRAELFVVIDRLNIAAQDPEFGSNAANNSAFLHPDVLLRLKSVSSARLDPSKLIRMCVELNDAYGRGNYITSALLLRAIINHVPPVFGTTTFSQTVAQAGRSVKATLSRLDEEARPIADLHSHILMRETEVLPTKNQLESYRPAFEILIQEVIVSLTDASTVTS